MSMALRLTQWARRSWACAGQSIDTQRKATSPSSRTTGLPQLGQCVGMWNSVTSAGRSSSTGPTTSGITSPALWTTIVSPTRTFLRRISSRLCRVARAIVEPATTTGSNSATGVSMPVRPTWIVCRAKGCVFSSGGNLKAIAQRGARACNPGPPAPRTSSPSPRRRRCRKASASRCARLRQEVVHLVGARAAAGVGVNVEAAAQPLEELPLRGDHQRASSPTA